MPDVIYVYGLVQKDFDASRLPTGIEDLAVTATDTGAFRTLISRLPGEQYRPDAIAQNSGDVAWVSPRGALTDSWNPGGSRRRQLAKVASPGHR